MGHYNRRMKQKTRLVHPPQVTVPADNTGLLDLMTVTVPLDVPEAE